MNRTSHALAPILLLSLAVAAGCNGGDDPRTDVEGNTPGGGGGATSSGGGGAPGAPGSVSGGVSGPDGGTSGGGPDGPGGGGPSDPPRPYEDFAINHVLFTGQSNSVSNSGIPVLSTTQPFGNLMFDTGVMPMTGCGGEGCKSYAPPSAFVPLVEGDKFFNYGVETSGASIANEISFLARGSLAGLPGLGGKHDVLVTLHGRSGNTYWCLRKGGCDYKPGYLSPFEQGMMEVKSAKDLAAAAGKSYVVRGVATIHGESDHYSYTDGSQEFPLHKSDGSGGMLADYADGLVEWQRDYESSVRAITGQKQPVPLFVSQISGWNDTDYSRVAQWQYEAHLRAPGKVILIGPAYHLEPAGDCRHFTNVGVQRLGEQFGKVYAKVVLEGKTWEPVHPRKITRAGAVITVQFHVPAPPLVIDTQRVGEAASFGFGFKDGSASPPAISKVEVTGPDTVTITLASEPTGADKHLTYAQNQVPLTCIGNPNGARGNLRDSDTTPSQHGFDLFNWAVHFDAKVE